MNNEEKSQKTLRAIYEIKKGIKLYKIPDNNCLMPNCVCRDVNQIIELKDFFIEQLAYLTNLLKYGRDK